MDGLWANAKQLDVHSVAAAGHCDHSSLLNPRRPGIGRHGFSFVMLSAEGAYLGNAQLLLIGDRNPALEGLLEGKSFLEAIEERKFARRITDDPAVLFGDGHVTDAKGGLVNQDHVWDLDQVEPRSDTLLQPHRERSCSPPQASASGCLASRNVTQASKMVSTSKRADSRRNAEVEWQVARVGY